MATSAFAISRPLTKMIYPLLPGVFLLPLLVRATPVDPGRSYMLETVGSSDQYN